MPLLSAQPRPDTVAAQHRTAAFERSGSSPMGDGTAMLQESVQLGTLLDRCILFRALDDSGKAALAGRVTHASYAAGAPIFHLGDPGDSMMIVANGTVRISLPTRQGRELILSDLGAGDVFGEVALLDGLPRSASATALTKCELIVIHRKDVLPFLRDHAEACLAIIALLCGRLRRADERMTDIGLSHLPVRLAKTLLGRTEGNVSKRIACSQSELADMVGSSRESVNRALRQWHQQGIVELNEGWIAVIDRGALNALAECA